MRINIAYKNLRESPAYKETCSDRQGQQGDRDFELELESILTRYGNGKLKWKVIMTKKSNQKRIHFFVLEKMNLFIFFPKKKRGDFFFVKILLTEHQGKYRASEQQVHLIHWNDPRIR